MRTRELNFRSACTSPLLVFGGRSKRPWLGSGEVPFLPGEDNFGELYFFEGQTADIAKLAIVSPVMFVPALTGELNPPPHREIVASSKAEMVSQPSAAKATRVLYTEEDGILSIAEIQTPQKIFRLPPTQ